MTKLARTWTKFIRSSYKGSTTFAHQYSHTGDHSFRAMGNDLADKRANLERLDAPSSDAPFTHGEAIVIPWMLWQTAENPSHIPGDVRRAMTRWCRNEVMSRWIRLPHQGRVVRSNPTGVEALCKLVRRRQSSADLMFALLALCEWLPCGRFYARQRKIGAAVNGQWSCAACPEPGNETSRHCIMCPAWMTTRAQAADDVCSLLLGTNKLRPRLTRPAVC